MFEATAKPRLFAMPPGVDFPAELAAGLLARLADLPPEALARVTVLVSTRRMQRRLKLLLSQSGARLLPRIGLVTDLDLLLPGADLPPPVSPLRRRIELTALVQKLIEADPDLAPRAAAADMADSLADLLDEVQGEGVAAEALLDLDVSDVSGHWARSLRFLSIVRDYTRATADHQIDTEARRRRASERLIEAWDAAPPEAPLLVAGSTGSRATTSMVIQAVSRLPQGAVVLPGFDFDLPEDVFADLTTAKFSPLGAQDHPQYRFASLLATLGMSKRDVRRWNDADDRKSRNALISLSLRPAPVTDKWLTEGPALGDLVDRTRSMALIEAPQPRDEALAIAVALRMAVEDGRTAALISPDRTLGRRVAAALQRWNIVPDDSAGRPLSLTAPGRFLRQIAGLVGKPVETTDLIALLKHPLTMSGGDARGEHLRMTREFELHIRRVTAAKVSEAAIRRFQDTRPPESAIWCDWLTDWLHSVARAPAPTLADALVLHIGAAERLAAGGATGSGALWDTAAGRDALALIERFRGEADYSGPLPFPDYARLLDKALMAESTRDHDTARTDVMIWGTLEARVQGADLVILGGLNEETWPDRPAPDPWLNRSLRRQAGLLLPERQIGLSAHDYQQAVAADTVILTRARRDAESDTVPSRWLSRLTSLLDGLPAQNGPAALAAMRAAGDVYLDLSRRLDTPDATEPPELRPAPAPPVTVRPTDYTVTEIERLIRDPYAIYARHVLGLVPLNPLRCLPDARLRGTVFHDIAEEALSLDADFADLDRAADRLRQIGDRHFARLPWPGVAAHWRGHLDAIASQIVEEEQIRRHAAQPLAVERKGRMDIDGTPFSIRGKADRIDRTGDGRLIIYDYKTGTPPKPDQIRHFDRQLLIEAVMAEAGAFEDVPAATVEKVAHIGLGRSPVQNGIPLVQSDDTDFRSITIAGELARLLQGYHVESKGYPSRRAMEKVRFEGDYDHLARFGEWDATSLPALVRLP